MKKYYYLLIALLLGICAFGQDGPKSISEKLESGGYSKVQIGGYGQIDFNQPVKEGQKSNGNLDVHRMVLLFGYRFNEKTNFVTEIEFEHVKEVFVEQAYLNHEILPWLDFRGGLMLVPMGIMNEVHEPPIFNGVERSNLDHYVVPTTWREIGAGFTGRFDNIALKYQLYVMNGFNGYNDGGVFRGKDGFRKGRQKGAESFMSSPTLATKIDYYGVPELKPGFSTYNGKSQSSLYNGVDKNDRNAMARADSSVVALNIFGIDVRYETGGLEARTQVNVSGVKNTEAYNSFTWKDLGSKLFGWYVELGYNVLQSAKTSQSLVPFVRYEQYNTHEKTAGTLMKNTAYDHTDITLGTGWWMTSGAVFKADYQWFNNGLGNKSGQFNFRDRNLVLIVI